MRAWNRAKLLWGYLRRKPKLNALPVEYIVETTAKCNLYCPMCPRETHKQPKEDMADEIFDAAGAGIGRKRRTHDADRPGRAVHGSQDFRSHRVLRTPQHLDAALHQRHVPRRENLRAVAGHAARTHHAELRRRDQGVLRVLPQGREVRKGARQFRALRAHEARARRQGAGGGPDGAHGAQRRRSGRFHPLLERGAGRGPGAHQGRRNQRAAAGSRPRGRRTGSIPATTCGAGRCT